MINFYYGKEKKSILEGNFEFLHPGPNLTKI